MGAVERQTNGQMKNKKKGVQKNFVGKKNGRNHPPFNTNSYPPYSQGMRPRPPFPGRMPPPMMPPGVRMPPGPPPLFRTRVPPPRGMGPRSLMPGPPMNMRPRPMGMPMRPLPPPLMRPPPPMGMGRFPPRGPPPMYPPKMRQLKNKMNKKNMKKKNQNQFDMSSPWVTEEIKAEFTKKEELLTKAKAANESTQTADWNAFKEQRSKCDKMYKAAKMEYIGKHPEEIFEDSTECSDESEYETEDEQINENFCDTCERSFFNNDQLQKHLQQHRVCGIDGCTYVAHEKVVEKHIEMQHITGLYYRIKKTETPEDVAKWIEERKRKYPSKENIEKRQKEQEERFKRGERLQKPNNRFGQNTKKVFQPRTPFPKPRAPKKIPKSKPTVSLISSKENWKGNICPFAGTSELYESETEIRENISDEEDWVSEKKDNKIVLNNALGALIGAYRSSDESDDEIAVPEIVNEAPEEVKIIKTEPELLPIDIKENIEVKRRKRTRFRNKNVEVKRSKPEIEQKSPQKVVRPPQRVVRKKITLLEKLLEPEIRHERNLILQCIRYVVSNNFFDKSSENTATGTLDTSTKD